MSDFFIPTQTPRWLNLDNKWLFQRDNFLQTQINLVSEQIEQGSIKHLKNLSKAQTSTLRNICDIVSKTGLEPLLGNFS